MCGICLLLHSRVGESDSQSQITPEFLEELTEKLKSRGPDCFQEIKFSSERSFELCFYSSVLHLRGSTLEPQPVQDDKGNILLWNGEIFNGPLCQSSISDTKVLSEKLSGCINMLEIVDVLGLIQGPYSLIYYQKCLNLLLFGRDIFGRRCLLWNISEDAFKLCSMALGKEKWKEVPTTGLFCLNLNEKNTKSSFVVYCFPWSTSASGLSTCHNKIDFSNVEDLILRTKENHFIENPVDKSLNRSPPPIRTNEDHSKISNGGEIETFNLLLEDSVYQKNVDCFEHVLSESVRRRVQNQPYLCKDCYIKNFSSCNHSSVGILYSGGLDSIVIAALAHRYLPKNQSIDLLNVAFASNEKLKDTSHKKSTLAFDTPDRLTGRSGVTALKAICPTRQWNFIEVNISEEMLVTQRKNRISQLLIPNCTVLDDSIGCAIWFAAHGEGFLLSDGHYENYKSPARVLLVGMGADEQLGGYSRHRAKFNNCGWEGLIDELALELDRIGSRNLGRDDRIISDNGVESRYPFLDENVVSYLNDLPVWLKMDLNLPRGLGEKLLLRLLAFKIGLLEAAVLPKRAIQFGSRIAKIENSKEKGSDICERLKQL
uniref:Asparagine synthetase domain-containing protein 1 n=1 Tax=Parasteatoda tepidariorum TaxID=114398 RepID=A0A2L2YMF4_PARTP